MHPRQRKRDRRWLVNVWPLCVAIAASASIVTDATSEDWPQWRGPARTGAVEQTSGSVIDRLPEAGLIPVWKTADALQGGWGSPVVSDGRVFLFNYTSERTLKGEVPPPRYPELAPEQRQRLEQEELQKYDEARSKEAVERAKQENSYFDNLHCFDAETGIEIWHQRWPGRFVHWGQSSTPTVAGDRILVMGSDRQAHCLATEDGATIWTTDDDVPAEIDEPISSSIAVQGDIGVVLADTLKAIDLRTGQVQWKSDSKTASGLNSSPVIWEQGSQLVTIVNVRGGKTVGVDLRTGDVLWSVDSQAENSSPVVVGDRLVTYAGQRKGGLRCYRLSEESPEEVWKYQRTMDPGATPLVTNERVIVPGDKTLACVDLSTGEEFWLEELDLARSQYTSPIAIGNRAIYTHGGVWLLDLSNTAAPILAEARVDSTGRLAGVEFFRRKLQMEELERSDPAKAEQLWQAEIVSRGPVDCTSPAVTDGRMFVRLQTGLACYDLRARGTLQLGSRPSLSKE